MSFCRVFLAGERRLVRFWSIAGCRRQWPDRRAGGLRRCHWPEPQHLSRQRVIGALTARLLRRCVDLSGTSLARPRSVRAEHEHLCHAILLTTLACVTHHSAFHRNDRRHVALLVVLSSRVMLMEGCAPRCQASVEMMSPKSDAGLSSGPALAGFGAFGQQADNPSSSTPAAAGQAGGSNASGPAFGGMSSFAAPGVAMFGSTDSRSAGAPAGTRLSAAHICVHGSTLVPRWYRCLAPA